MTGIRTHEPAAEVLRGAGLRVTESRTAVYEALQSAPHASADDVFAQIVTRMPRASRQSVYNALGDFADAGIVRRIEPAGRPMLFELRIDDNHHHLVCTSCGAVVDVDCAVGSAPCLEPSDAHGFTVAAAEVTYWGVCAVCAEPPASAQAQASAQAPAQAPAQAQAQAHAEAPAAGKAPAPALGVSAPIHRSSLDPRPSSEEGTP